MVTLCYCGRSRITAEKIAEASDGEIEAVRSKMGDVNWGRNDADTELNPDTSKATNKRIARELFRDNDVPMPRLMLDETDALNCVHLANKTLVGRPDYHMKSRGFWLCRNENDVRRALAGTHRKAAATHFMEYIDAVAEYRVHVFLGKSIRISEKRFEGADGNHKIYTTAKPMYDKQTRRAVRRAAKQAVEAIGLDLGAVDVLVDSEGNPYVLEVNSSPGLGGSLPKLYADKILEWNDGR